MRSRWILAITALSVLALGGPAAAQSSAGGSSTGGSSKSSVRIKTSGPATVGYNSGGVAEGSTASGSTSSGGSSGGETTQGTSTRSGDAVEGAVTGANVGEGGSVELEGISKHTGGTSDDYGAADLDPAGAHGEGTVAGPDVGSYVMIGVLLLMFGFLWTKMPKPAA